MSETVLPQLEEIISNLTEQEASISAQLAEVQSKLEALRSVTDLFDGNAEVAAKAPAAAKSTATKKTATKASSPKSTKKSTSTTKAKTKKTSKKDGRAASWQKYTRAGVGKQPMPEAVRLILETQPDKDFKIAEVMSSLFKDDMPKSQYLKARNRISNILSGGVRNGDWYKGDRGAYRLTAK